MNLEERIHNLCRLRDVIDSWWKAFRCARYAASATNVVVICSLGLMDEESPSEWLFFLAAMLHLISAVFECFLIRLYLRIDRRISMLSGFQR